MSRATYASLVPSLVFTLPFELQRIVIEGITAEPLRQHGVATCVTEELVALQHILRARAVIESISLETQGFLYTIEPDIDPADEAHAWRLVGFLDEVLTSFDDILETYNFRTLPLY